MQSKKAKDLVNKLSNIYDNGLKKKTRTKEITETFNRQVNYEEEYKNSSKICHHDGSGEIYDVSQAELSGLNKEKIIEKLKYNFYDPYFMSQIRCIMNTILDKEGVSSDSERASIHRFISDPKRFGSNSVYSYALKTDFVTSEEFSSKRKKHDLFRGEMVVVKCPREPSSSKELIHELCVGLRLADLRKYGCCNFSMVYDAWYCSAPVVNDENNEVVNWCMASNNPVSYVAYEMIHDAKPIADITKDFSSNTHLKAAQYLMQTSIALSMAERMAGFQHQDSHSENLLLRPNPTVRRNRDGDVISTKIEPFYSQYNYNGRTVYVPSPGEIVTFIDYGMSRCVMEDGENIGKLDSNGYFTNCEITSRTDGNVVCDMYKLVCSLLRESMARGNNRLTSFLSMIVSAYFIDDPTLSFQDVTKYINLQAENSFTLPVSVANDYGLNIVNFTDFLRDLTMNLYDYELIYDEPPEGSKIFGVNEHFEEIEEIRKEIGMDVAEVPSFYDLSVAYTQNSNKFDEIKARVERHFNYLQNQEMASNDTLFFNKVKSPLFGIGTTRAEIEADKTNAARNIEDIAGIAKNCYDLKEKLIIYRNCNEVLGNNLLSKLITQCQRRLTEDTSYIEKVKTQLLINFRSIKNCMPNVLDAKDSLFELYDKYDKTISAIRKIGMTL